MSRDELLEAYENAKSIADQESLNFQKICDEEIDHEKKISRLISSSLIESADNVRLEAAELKDYDKYNSSTSFYELSCDRERYESNKVGIYFREISDILEQDYKDKNKISDEKMNDYNMANKAFYPQTDEKCDKMLKAYMETRDEYIDASRAVTKARINYIDFSKRRNDLARRKPGKWIL